MLKKAKKGFTIVELVIVIAVIAILAAVLIPTFTGVVGKAEDSAALADAKNAYTQYMVDQTEANKDPEKDLVIVVNNDETTKYIYEVTNGVLADKVATGYTYTPASGDTSASLTKSGDSSTNYTSVATYGTVSIYIAST